MASKTPTSKLGHGNRPLAKNKRQKEGLNREPGREKEVSAPSEVMRQKKQDTLGSISRTLGKFVNSPKYEDFGLDIGYNYKVQMVIKTELYCKIMARKFSIEGCIKSLYWILRITM